MSNISINTLVNVDEEHKIKYRNDEKFIFLHGKF